MTLESIRKQIDAIDIQLQELIERRANLGRQIAEFKRAEETPQYFVPEREAQILAGVRQRSADVLPIESLEQIFREIISATRSLENPMRVAILGPEATFTHAAANAHFGHAIETVFRTTINDVFSAVEIGRAEFGVVPVENSIEGVVNNTLDCLLESPLRLCGEVRLQVHHALISGEPEIESITSVSAHPQALAQCRQWLNRRLPGVEQRKTTSTAEAVKSIVGVPRAAAIGSEAAASLYGVNVVHPNIEDKPNNTTRFLIIGKIGIQPTGNDKTCIMVSKTNEPGSLFKLLEPFAKLGVNMSKIESRPSQKQVWDYVFFIDFDGHCDDPVVQDLFIHLQEKSSLFKHLGSFPQPTD